MPQQQRSADTMENAGFEREDTAALTPGGGGGRVATVELREVATQPPPASSSPPLLASELLSVNGTGAVSCSAHCQALHLQHQRQYAAKAAEAAGAAGAGPGGGRPPPESPWHHLKTVFLVGTLIFLALWIVVYTLLSQFAVL